MHIICVNRISIGDETFAIRSAHTDHSAEQALFHWHNFIPLLVSLEMLTAFRKFLL